MISSHFLLWVVFLVQAYHRKFQSSMKRPKSSRAWLFDIAICFMVLCIIPPNFRLIAKILKKLKQQCRPSHLVPSLFWKFQSSVECGKISQACPFLLAICFLVLCIIPPNFRQIAVPQTWSKPIMEISKFCLMCKIWLSRAILYMQPRKIKESLVRELIVSPHRKSPELLLLKNREY